MTPDLRPGMIVDGKYQLDVLLGAGGFGVVFAATHLGLQRRVALKLLTRTDPTGEFFRRFRAEAEALGRLAHPNIVAVTDFGIDPSGHGQPYLAMELIEGTTLDERFRVGAVPWPEAHRILSGVAAAIDAAHAAGVVHGDLTARNVLLAGTPVHQATAKVIDFGLTRLAALEIAAPAPAAAPLEAGVTGLLCTPEYCAPEVARGERPTSASDIYAFGVIAYRVLTGYLPFEGPADAVIRGHLGSPPAPPSSRDARFSPDADRALLLALAKHPGDRTPRASDALKIIATAIGRDERRRWLRTQGPRRLAAALALAALSGVIGAMSIAWAPAARLEYAALDAWGRVSPVRDPDPRLLLVSIDERFLTADSTPLAQAADRFARAIDRACAAGARVVALDLLLPAQWAESETFGRLLLTRADQIALATAWTDDGRVVGVEGVDPLVSAALGPERMSRLFAIVNREADADGRVRRARAAYPDTAGTWRSTLAGRIAALSAAGRGVAPRGPVLIDLAVDWRRLDRRTWLEFERLVAAGTSLHDRLLIVGAEFTGSGDLHMVPAVHQSAAEVSGLELQARMVDALLQPRPRLWRSDALVFAAMALWLAVPVVVVLLARTWRAALWPVLAAAVAWIVAAWVLWLEGTAVPVAVPLVLLSLIAVAAIGLRTRWGLVPS